MTLFIGETYFLGGKGQDGGIEQVDSYYLYCFSCDDKDDDDDDITFLITRAQLVGLSKWTLIRWSPVNVVLPTYLYVL